MTDRGLTIGTLARQAGVNVETIRYYQRRGLLVEPTKPPRGVRHYSGADVARIHFIKSAQRLGFALDEITLLLRLEDGTHCVEARVRIFSQEHAGEASAQGPLPQMPPHASNHSIRFMGNHSRCSVANRNGREADTHRNHPTDHFWANPVLPQQAILPGAF